MNLLVQIIERPGGFPPEGVPAEKLLMLQERRLVTVRQAPAGGAEALFPTSAGISEVLAAASGNPNGVMPEHAIVSVLANGCALRPGDLELLHEAKRLGLVSRQSLGEYFSWQLTVAGINACRRLSLGPSPRLASICPLSLLPLPLRLALERFLLGQRFKPRDDHIDKLLERGLLQEADGQVSPRPGVAETLGLPEAR